MPRCKSCGASIQFIETPGGKLMPCEVSPVMYVKKEGGSAKIVTPKGEVVSCEIVKKSTQANGYGYISHFANCPFGGRHRKRAAGKAARK